jgi:hypothetical protein
LNREARRADNTNYIRILLSKEKEGSIDIHFAAVRVASLAGLVKPKVLNQSRHDPPVDRITVRPDKRAGEAEKACGRIRETVMDRVSNETQIPLVVAQMAGDPLLLVSESSAENGVVLEYPDGIEAIAVRILDNLNVTQKTSVDSARSESI